MSVVGVARITEMEMNPRTERIPGGQQFTAGVLQMEKLRLRKEK